MFRSIGKFVYNTFSIKNVNIEPLRCQSMFRGRDKKTTHLSPYIIVRATTCDHDDILKLMYDHYFPFEPTFTSLGITKNPALDEEIFRLLEEGLTLVAKCKYNGTIAGASINQSTHPWDPDMKEKLACTVQCPKVRKLLLFQAHVQRTPQLWDCYDIQKIFEMTHVFVAREHKNQGLELRLLRDSKVLGTDCGYGVIRCDASNVKLSQLCEQLNMKMIRDIPYNTYVSRDNKPIISSIFPNESVKIYIDDNPQMWYMMNLTRKPPKFI